MSTKKAAPAKGKLTRRDRLQAEIASALEEIDEEGLVFLLEQANVLLHNARVEELQAKRRSRAAADGEEPTPPAPEGPAVEVEESGDGKSFFLTINKQRKILSRQEMQQVARICHDAETVTEGARRLYTVFARERRDILVDGGIAGAGSPLLGALVELVRGRYRPRAG